MVGGFGPFGGAFPVAIGTGGFLVETVAETEGASLALAERVLVGAIEGIALALAVSVESLVPAVVRGFSPRVTKKTSPKIEATTSTAATPVAAKIVRRLRFLPAASATDASEDACDS